ncbi:bifunctional diaminohydroxyphosphoribosylaminopyrimidine deaminase/5-amino-6-(5-phosphoribosylamino)uracil reductase RibD [Candidatus Magnetominusculus xianensis]|uniref:Riboflavin biosynthesis protein RibD n=1 Tax=Candidatus Magnetominusculus xianensis TaxID=1748249 RepID=A0ABR5SCX9_9BACT|nr:bifunctional diaminohydroxyphosphoribosylaminopyrimidine deaminase/5-amino-6-(5-phosphoribosylamino)uracil reductase RibD [Candidatus Magnetominusculus xianensis]KWT82512.1 bifunctional diaminohydroxyphosphoribosylaminopyrimidine deaminase/5-amino-6-(5-phosphoribosylamino)uracil reductase [Candidatus Magnetominusculus xianensis]MBF0405408.1 bifunctional diaminohydroxyphosphoribosylaminopyrimidine deaminase/5-amino-6-(5-phosphoribosylamino)uracil reductase RibD [Nitrospirota bacterium]
MDDISLMRRCIALARRACGSTSPNPMVGAILYKDGQVIAEDYHRKAGEPHAEALVLKRAGAEAEGATLYVSLEPCCHTGKRTPPCTDAIIGAKIKRVVAAMLDPNPSVSGMGLVMLKKAGIETTVGILQTQAERLNEVYIKYITTKIPFVILKAAMTLDGKMAAPDGQSKWITCEKSRRYVHRIRSSVDAVLTAIGTVKADNPRLTARGRGLRSPVRVCIDPSLETPLDYAILKTPPRTIIVTKEQAQDTGGFAPGVELIHYDGRLDLKWLMQELGQRHITSVMIEGGASLTGHAVEDGIVDKVIFFIAPKIIGGKGVYCPVSSKTFRSIESPYEVYDMRARALGTDIVIEGYL